MALAPADLLARAFFAPAQGLSPSGGHLPLHAQLHNGDKDPFVTIGTDAATIVQILNREGATTEPKTYVGAGHGFIGTDAANTKARAESKADTLAFFTTHL
jgi:dienelactone hydrolase